MARVRVILTLITILVVGTFASLIGLYARGYRFNPNKLKFNPNGIFVVKSVPDGAQIFLNGELETATNATIPLPPRTYDVSIKKEGFLAWNKRLVIEKEVVTEITAHLFKSAPSLSAVTFAGTTNPIPSYDLSKIAYVVPPNPNIPVGQEDKSGLWIMETVNLPIGFSKEPRQITDGVLTDVDWIWSPDGRQILLTSKTGSYLLDAGKFTPQSERINLASSTKDEIINEWGEEQKRRFETQLKSLPEELSEILVRKSSSLVFSPDEKMIVYTASQSATIPADLIKPLPGASTQKQERDIKKDHTYVYDIKEDRNFLIDESSSDLVIEGGHPTKAKRRLSWFPTSRHLILAEENKITILDYDGTNRQTVYSGSYVAPHAFPALSLARILILISLGGDSSLPNLYSLGLK